MSVCGSFRPLHQASSGQKVSPSSRPRTVSALEMTYFGALVHAGSGYVSYREIADRLTYVVGLILGDHQ